MDTAIQRVIEFLRSIPKIPVWMGMAAAVPTEWPPLWVYFMITLIVSLLAWTSLAREVRGKFMALRAVSSALWFLFVPGSAVVVAILTLNFLGDGIRDAADPCGRRLSHRFRVDEAAS